MKLQKLLLTLILVSTQFQSWSKSQVLFSPYQGEEAFEKLYQSIAKATKRVYLTTYSWSDKKVLDSLLLATQGGAEVKVVLHAGLDKNEKIKSFVSELESVGAEVKVSPMNMHEKFILVDDEMLINGSANLSGGAKSKYSENIVFHEIESGAEKNLLTEFNNEFSVLWNTSKNVTNHQLDSILKIKDENNLPSKKETSLYSSSMNFTLKENAKTSQTYKTGRSYALVKRGGSNQTWFVRDMLIEKISKAKKNIYVSMNHLNIREVSDALIEAVKRGVDVRLNVDNQEFKTAPNNKEMSPQFVQDWKNLPGNKLKEAPVRVKFYSFAPSPRYWYLNHHKYFLIDFDESDLSKTTLISGSYNVSRTAEQSQFDNMIVYTGLEFSELYKGFKSEFDILWSLNRDSEDRPNEEVIRRLTNPYNDQFYIHSSNPISLKWSEALNVKKQATKVAPLMFKQLFKFRDCKVFNIKTHEFGGC